jgi:hypothetical protein
MLGRPPLISESDIDAELPRAIDDSFITPDGIHEGAEEQLTYSHDMLRTFSKQIRNVYECLYNVKACKERTQSNLVDTLRAVNGELNVWRATFPEDTSPFPRGELPVSFAGISLQKVYNSIASGLCQCLAYRPALVEVTKASLHDWPAPRHARQRRGTSHESHVRSASQVDPLSEFLQFSADSCVAAARDILNLINRAQVYGNCHVSYGSLSNKLMV